MICLAEFQAYRNAVRTLLNAVSGGRVAHAYLFAGPAKDKEDLAAAFARALLCSRPRQGDACGECLPCRQVLQLNHPDLHWLKPSGAAIKIDQIREMQRRVLYRSYQGGRKVFVLEPAEAMTAEAANSLLKTLEEPPADTVFILVSNRPGACLPTILSRCQQFYFQDTGAGTGVEKAEGGINPHGLASRLALAGPAEALALAAEAAVEDVPHLLDGLARWYRDILTWQQTGLKELLFCPDRAEEAAKESYSYNPARLVDMIEEIEMAARRIERNVNKRLVLEVLFLSLATGK